MCYIGRGFSIHIHDLLITIDKIHKVASMQDMDGKIPIFLHLSFEGCPLMQEMTMHAEICKGICTVSWQEKQGMWMGNKVRNE